MIRKEITTFRCKHCKCSYDGKGVWIIWSLGHKGWWGHDWNGYVGKRKDAGLYSFDEACKIIKGANIGDHDVPNEAMIKVYD